MVNEEHLVAPAGGEDEERGAIDLEVLGAALATLRERGVRVEDADEVLAHVAGILALCLLERGVENREEAVRWVGETALDLYEQIVEGPEES